MQLTDWEVEETEGGLVISRLETPVWMWLLDRWFRIPDATFDWIEWRFPRTAPITQIPCLLYSRGFPSSSWARL
jgi:hypothetical protein